MNRVNVDEAVAALLERLSVYLEFPDMSSQRIAWDVHEPERGVGADVHCYLTRAMSVTDLHYNLASPKELLSPRGSVVLRATDIDDFAGDTFLICN